MALVSCPECGKEISDSSNACIHCGYVLAKKKSLVEIAKEYKSKLIPIGAILLVIILGVSLFATGIIGMSSAERAASSNIKTLQKTLLDPSSIILYEVYQSFEYSENKSATLIHYGAKNKGGGITDDWAYVSDKELQSYNEYEKAVRNDDNTTILANGTVMFAKYNLELTGTGEDSMWKSIDVDKIQKRIK